jgi:hypothetical protein
MILPADIRTDIARAVRSVRPELQGYCWFRQTLGQHALAMLGIRTQLVIGSMLYRAGPDPLYDTLTYTSGRDNAGWFGNEGTLFDPITEAGPHATLAGHCWLETDDGELIDLTPGDRQAHFDELRATLRDVPPINWTVLPASFIWQKAEPLKSAWRITGAPPLGQCWYGPLRVPRGTKAAVRAQVAWVKNQALNTVRQVLPFLERNMAVLNLPERVRIHRADGDTCDKQDRGIGLRDDPQTPRSRDGIPTQRVRRA